MEQFSIVSPGVSRVVPILERQSGDTVISPAPQATRIRSAVGAQMASRVQTVTSSAHKACGALTVPRCVSVTTPTPTIVILKTARATVSQATRGARVICPAHREPLVSNAQVDAIVHARQCVTVPLEHASVLLGGMESTASSGARRASMVPAVPRIASVTRAPVHLKMAPVPATLASS